MLGPGVSFHTFMYTESQLWRTISHGSVFFFEGLGTALAVDPWGLKITRALEASRPLEFKPSYLLNLTPSSSLFLSFVRNATLHWYISLPGFHYCAYFLFLLLFFFILGNETKNKAREVKRNLRVLGEIIWGNISGGKNEIVLQGKI